MEQSPGKNNPRPEWTKDFLLSQLSQLAGAAAGTAPTLGSYHKAAAVLVSFNPESIKPFEPSTPDTEDFERLLADITTVHDEQGRPASMLLSEVRKRTLASMATPQKLKEALTANPVRPQTSLQNMFEAYIQGSAPDIAQQTLDQLGATLQVIEWLPPDFPNLPKAEHVQRLVERESLLKPFRDLATENFTGRTTELRDLRIYVDFLPSQGALESFQRFLSWDEKPPRIIYGPGGMGKSALLSKFILDHIAPKDGTRAIPFVYLDFDRPNLAAEEPRTLLMEAARQLAIQVTDLSTLAILRQSWIAQTSETSRPELADMLSAFGSAFRASSVSNDPVLFVADTFEVVQYRGAEITAEVIGLLDSLRKEIPRLRAVISGRAPVNTPDYPTENVSLNKLNVTDAAAYLTRQGISTAVATKVAAQVGGSPLSLRLAIEILKREGFATGGIANLEVRDWLYRRLQDSLIQGQLYRRILDYIKDEDVRKLAYPGLVLRRITRELIKDVLAGPCGVKVNDDAVAGKLFQGLQQEVSLVTPAEDGSLHHRPEVREAMLQLMRRDEPVKLRSIQTAAVDYYRNSARTDAEKAELLYHLAALGRPRSELEDVWELGLEKFLGGVLPELPPASRAFLAPLIHEPLDEEARKFLAREDSERTAAQQARNFLLLERPEQALQALSLPFPDLSPAILMLRAVSFVQLSRWVEARDALDAAFLSAHEGSDPRLALKLEVLEARVLAQTARRIDVSLTEERRRHLQSALISAFPKYDALQSLAAALGQLLQDVSRATSPDSAALDLISWTEENNLLEELIGAARRLNARNSVLNQFADSAGVDRAPAPSPARSNLPGQGLSYGRRLVDRYRDLIGKFLDDPRLLRVGLYFWERYRKRGAEEPRRREQLEDLVIQLFQRIPSTDLISFGPLCLEVAGRLGPRKPNLLAFVLARFGMPELSRADRARFNELLAEWDKVVDGGVSGVAGTSWQQVVLQGDPIRVARMLQELFEKLGYLPALTEAIAANMLAATSRVPEKTLFEELERVSQFWTDATQLAASLAEALNKFNWTEANSICAGVVTRCRDAALPFPTAPARQMLTSLRRKRQFAMMEMLGATFAATMPENAQIKRLYAQALADQGKLVEAETVLKDLLARTPPLAEEAEAKGLLGRIEKQCYIDAPTGAGSGEHLLKAIRIYLEVYKSNPGSNLWHGINSVALIARAERDGLAVFEFPDSRALAQEILSVTSAKDDLYAWDYATMVEAAVAIGDYRLAQINLNHYISDPSCDAFELGSTLRQLREVWQLSTEQDPGATLLPPLEATLLQRQGGFLEPTSQQIASVVASGAFNRGPVAPSESGSASFQQLAWYRTGLLRAASVARIETPVGSPRGTGFLVKAADFFRGAPERAIILLTAAHVVAAGEASDAPPAQAGVVVFEEEAKVCRLGRLLWSSPSNQLDAAFLSVEGLPADAAYCPMPPSPRRGDQSSQQRVYVIGYPSGGGLTFSLQDGLLLDSDGSRFHYRAATAPGSGGSPVFDGHDWTPLALHHARSSRMAMLNGKSGFYEAGEGISLDAIRAATLVSAVRFEQDPR